MNNVVLYIEIQLPCRYCKLGNLPKCYQRNFFVQGKVSPKAFMYGNSAGEKADLNADSVGDCSTRSGEGGKNDD